MAKLTETNIAVQIKSPHTAGQCPNGLRFKTYIPPTKTPPTAMLQIAPAAVALFQKKHPTIAGSWSKTPPHALADITAFKPKLSWQI